MNLPKFFHMEQKPTVAPSFSRLQDRTQLDTPHFVERLWTRDLSEEETSI